MASTATIHTTTNATVLRYVGTRRIERQTATGHLFYVSYNGNAIQVYRSTNNGTSWSTFGGTRTTGDSQPVQEMGGFFVDWQNRLYITYRTSQSSLDKIWMQAGVITTTGTSWHTALLVASGANGGTPGSYLTGMTPIIIRHNDGKTTGFVAVGWQNSTRLGVACYGFTIPPAGQPSLNLGVVSGTRSWSFLQTGGGHQVPGGSYELSPAHAWITWGRTYLYTVKLSWNGSGWTGPSTPVRLSAYGAGVPEPPAMEGVATAWRNPGLLVAQPYQYETNKVVVFERNQANSRTVQYVTPVHPAGVVRHCTIAYNNVSRDFRVWAVGTSDNLLYYADFIQASSTWTGWSSVSATAVSGTNAENYSVRRESYQSAKYDVVYENGGGSPWNVTHVSQDLTYAPYAPFWKFASTTNSMAANGTAWHTARDLDLVWVFSDPDTADVQTAWALSRQIGAGTVQYLRASDGTWQATEQKNIGATSSRTLAGFFWGTPTDANHTYKVKVWDGTDTASVYSAALTVIPSDKVNPTITSPAADGMTVTTDTLRLEWTVAEQTAFRIKVQILTDVLYDSGWIAGNQDEYLVPFRMDDGWNYSFVLATRNNEGLESDAAVRTILCDIFQPPAPTLTVTPISADGLIRIQITNPAPAALNTNTGFETNTTGWQGVGSSSFTRSTAQARTGTASARVVPTGAAASTTAETTTTHTGSPGDSFTLWGWIRPDTDNGKQLVAYLHWFNGATFVSTVSSITPVQAAGAWQEVQITGTMPAGCTRVVAALGRTNTPAAGDAFYVDDVRLMAGAQPRIARNYINRRKDFSVFDNSTLVVVADEVPENGTYDDWTVRSGYPYEYQVVAVGDNGTSISSAYTS